MQLDSTIELLFVLCFQIRYPAENIRREDLGQQGSCREEIDSSAGDLPAELLMLLWSLSIREAADCTSIMVGG